MLVIWIIASVSNESYELKVDGFSKHSYLNISSAPFIVIIYYSERPDSAISVHLLSCANVALVQSYFLAFTWLTSEFVGLGLYW